MGDLAFPTPLAGGARYLSLPRIRPSQRLLQEGEETRFPHVPARFLESHVVGGNAAMV